MAHRLGFAGKKLLRMVLLLLGVSLAAFLLMSASPLDPLPAPGGHPHPPGGRTAPLCH